MPVIDDFCTSSIVQFLAILAHPYASLKLSYYCPESFFGKRVRVLVFFVDATQFHNALYALGVGEVVLPDNIPYGGDPCGPCAWRSPCNIQVYVCQPSIYPP